MVLCIEPKISIKKLSELIREFGREAKYKINVYESIVLIYTNNIMIEKELVSTNLFKTVRKILNCLE